MSGYPLCCIQSHHLSIFLPPPCPFSLLSHSPFHPSTPPPLFSTLLYHPPTSSIMSRPCAMVVPDFELIAEIMLVAEGFLEARLLARKFLTLYTLCKVQCVYNHSLASMQLYSFQLHGSVEPISPSKVIVWVQD